MRTREEQIAAGGCWGIPGLETWWIRPLDGALVTVKSGRVRMPRASRGKGALVHSLGSTSRSAAALVRAALADPSAEPACYIQASTISRISAGS